MKTLKKLPPTVASNGALREAAEGIAQSVLHHRNLFNLYCEILTVSAQVIACPKKPHPDGSIEIGEADDFVRGAYYLDKQIDTALKKIRLDLSNFRKPNTRLTNLNRRQIDLNLLIEAHLREHYAIKQMAAKFSGIQSVVIYANWVMVLDSVEQGKKAFHIVS